MSYAARPSKFQPGVQPSAVRAGQIVARNSALIDLVHSTNFDIKDLSDMREEFSHLCDKDGTIQGEKNFINMVY